VPAEFGEKITDVALDVLPAPGMSVAVSSGLPVGAHGPVVSVCVVPVWQMKNWTVPVGDPTPSAPPTVTMSLTVSLRPKVTETADIRDADVDGAVPTTTHSLASWLTAVVLSADPV
jgi:hypothetical protein